MGWHYSGGPPFLYDGGVGRHGQTRGRGRPQGTGPGPHRHLHKPTRTAGEHQFHTDPTTDNMKLVSDTHTAGRSSRYSQTLLSVLVGSEMDWFKGEDTGDHSEQRKTTMPRTRTSMLF